MMPRHTQHQVNIYILLGNRLGKNLTLTRPWKRHTHMSVYVRREASVLCPPAQSSVCFEICSGLPTQENKRESELLFKTTSMSIHKLIRKRERERERDRETQRERERERLPTVTLLPTAQSTTRYCNPPPYSPEYY
jgi:hypothetical protein